MFEGTGSAGAELLGLPGAVIDLVEREADGSWRVHVRSAAGVGCCPGCGQVSGRVRELAGQRLAHLVVVPMALTWHKARFWCDNTSCGQGSFVESGPLAGRGGRVSQPARETMGRLVGDWLVPVSRVAGAAGVGWHTAHGGFVAVAERAGIVAEAGAAGRELLEAGAADTAPAPVPARSVSGPLPQVTVLGIDDHRRGRPRFHRAPDGTWAADADRWQTVFVDTAGGHGLLGQVEGRTTAGTTGWLAAQSAAWLAGIGAVTIDMSTTYQAAVREALPHAMLAVDPFHVVDLANKAIGDVRRRLTQQIRGRRGRADDPEYKIRNLLVRAEETLSDAARGRLLCTLADLGDAGRQCPASRSWLRNLDLKVGYSGSWWGV